MAFFWISELRRTDPDATVDEFRHQDSWITERLNCTTNEVRYRCVMQQLNDDHSQLRPRGSRCTNGGCPTVYDIDGHADTIAVKGYLQMDVEEEAIVYVPKSLLEDAFGTSRNS